MLHRVLTPRIGRSESRSRDCYRPHSLPAVEPRLPEPRPLRKHASGLLTLREAPRARVIAPQARGPPLEKRDARTKLTSESRFTGKEDDVEVGLTYFGKRFLSTNLNRWVSAGPLTIHGLGADLNVYAYVSGRALQSVDPLGLGAQETGVDAGEAPSEMNGWGRLGTGASTPTSPVPRPAAPAPKSRPGLAAGALGEAITAYGEKIVEQLKQGATAGAGLVIPAAPNIEALDNAHSAHQAAKAGDWGGMLENAIKVTPAGQFAGTVKGLGEGMGASAQRLETAWKAGDVGGAVGAGMDLKRGVEQTGVMVAGTASGRPAAAFHKHHTIPREILKHDLPADVAKAVRGKAGAPNRWSIPTALHKAIHKGRGGGAYNEAFKQRLRDLGRQPTVSDALRIRDDLVEQSDWEPIGHETLAFLRPKCRVCSSWAPRRDVAGRRTVATSEAADDRVVTGLRRGRRLHVARSRHRYSHHGSCGEGVEGSGGHGIRPSPCGDGGELGRVETRFAAGEAAVCGAATLGPMGHRLVQARP